MVRKRDSVRLLIGAVVALLFVAACGLISRPTATPPRPSPVLPTLTLTSLPSTPTTVVFVTPTALATTSPTPTPTATIAAPTSTVLPGTQVPATSTSTAGPTSVPPTRTSTPVPPTPTSTPTQVPPTTVVITDWRGEYFGNPSLQGTAKVIRNDKTVDLTLPLGTVPAAELPGENWSARWTRTWNFTEGNYRFHLLVDDGARLWVGGRLLIDAWVNGPAREFTETLYLRGDVPIKLEYYNGPGNARVRLNWEQVTQYQGWLGSYYAVQDLSGLPVFQRDDAAIDFDWGQGAPRFDLPADNFSARWIRSLTFAQSGLYLFRAESDDGVRLWVDGKLVITAWSDGSAVHEGVVSLTAGKHSLQLDYYEHAGNARVKLTWASAQATSTPTKTPTVTPTKTPTATVRPTNTPVPVPDTPIPPTKTPTVRPTNTPVPVPDTPIPPTKTPTVRPTNTPVPVPDTPIPPTETPTVRPTNTPLPLPDTPVPPTKTPTVRPTNTPLPVPDTPVPPTNTPPVTGQPTIALQPDKGPIGIPFQVLGKDWPGGALVDLLLVRPLAKPGVPVLASQVVADPEGKFRAKLIIPKAQGWEGLPEAIVLARVQNTELRARARYRLLPALDKIQSRPIPADQDRFALPRPTYLVLDSQEAWQERFGPEPPPGEPPVDWKRDLVIGAFLGEQPAELKVEIGSIVQRETTVSVWLTAIVPEGDRGTGDNPNKPRALVRVVRNAIKLPKGDVRQALVFAFLDASGRLLAQGPIGAIEPLQGAPVPEAKALGAALPESTVVVEVGALKAAPLEGVSPTAEIAQPSAEPPSDVVAASEMAAATAVEVAAAPTTEVAVVPATEVAVVPATEVTAAPAAVAAEPGPQTGPAETREPTPPFERIANWPWTGIGLGLLVTGAVALLAALGVYVGHRQQ